MLARSTVAAAICLALAGSTAVAALQLPDNRTWGLKDAYAGSFKIGISTFANKQFLNAPTSTIIQENAEVLLTETDLIWSSVEVRDGEYYWDDVDQYLDWCDANGIEPIGHCLIWKGIGWMSSYSGNMTEEEHQQLYLTRMEDYIATVLGRYKDRIKRWVVVNEWFDTKANIREDWVYIKTLGKRGIEAAYTWAQKYGSPSNRFYHSENSLTIWDKTKGVSRYLRELKAKGLRIDGIFFQGHQWHEEGPSTDFTGAHNHASIAQFERAIKHWGKSGFKVVLSEMDITVLPDGWDCCRNTSLVDYDPATQAGLNPYPSGMDPVTAQMQRDKWVRMFEMLLRQRSIVTDVHMWGVTDATSWYNKWPIKGRTDYPTLFGRDAQPKPQYYDLLRIAPNQPPGVLIPNPPTQLN